jgi:hypothetical protein
MASLCRRADTVKGGAIASAPSSFTPILSRPYAPAVSGFSVATAGPSDIDALVASVEALFHEEGKHDPFMDVEWPTREGTEYHTGLEDPDCLLPVARRGAEVVGHRVGNLVGPDQLRLARFAVLESMRVRQDVRGHGVGSLLVDEFVLGEGDQELSRRA